MDSARRIGLEVAKKRDQAWQRVGAECAARVKPQDMRRDAVGHDKATDISQIELCDGADDRNGLAPELQGAPMSPIVWAGASTDERASDSLWTDVAPSMSIVTAV